MLKKYKEPLTEESLKRLHATKERKRKHENMKPLAQKEAKERAAQLRKQQAGIQKQTRIQVLKASQQSSQTLKPYILVEIGNNRETEMALIDTGADVNAITYETWASLGQPKLDQSTIRIDTFSGLTMAVEGNLKLQVFIGNTDVHAEFLVMKPGMLATPIILGQSWQQQFNGIINWREEGLNFEVDGSRYFTPFYNEETSSQEGGSETNQLQTQQPKSAPSPTNNQRWKWVPKPTLLNSNQRYNTKEKKIPEKYSRKPAQITKRWIPKPLLQAQGYYVGASHLWLPKQRDLTLHVPTKPTNPTAKNSMHTQTKASDMQGARKQLQVWRAKDPQNSPIVVATSTQNEQHITLRWVRKISTPMESAITKEMLTIGKI